MSVELDHDILRFTCPNLNCGRQFEVLLLEVNCKIFRCGIFKSNFQQINPHESKELCDKYALDNIIFGCGRPFQLVQSISVWSVEICEYI